MPDNPTLKNALIVTTYDELTHFFSQFVAVRLPLLMVIGDPGISKSQSVRRAVGNRAHLFLETHATAFGMYHQIYQHRGLPIIIDDLDHLYRDQASIRLLKCLCNTDPIKRLSWSSKHSDIAQGRIPASFTTTSPVCLIANEWRTVNTNVRAIEDRAILVHFTPSAGEVHIRVREWFDDDVVFDFIEAHLRYITRPSMRFYVKGKQLRKACPDKWTAQLLTIMGLDENVKAIRDLLCDSEFANDADRVAAFEARGLGSRATYYRWKKKYGMT